MAILRLMAFVLGGGLSISYHQEFTLYYDATYVALTSFLAAVICLGLVELLAMAYWPGYYNRESSHA